MNYTEWNSTQLKVWILYYVKYHNDVIYFLGNLTASGPAEGGAQNVTVTGMLSSTVP